MNVNTMPVQDLIQAAFVTVEDALRAQARDVAVASRVATRVVADHVEYFDPVRGWTRLAPR